MTLKLEVGKTYISGDNDFVTILPAAGYGVKHIFIGNNNRWYHENGRLFLHGRDLHDLLEEITEDLPEPGYYWLVRWGEASPVRVDQKDSKYFVDRIGYREPLPLVQTVSHPNNHVAINELHREWNGLKISYDPIERLMCLLP